MFAHTYTGPVLLGVCLRPPTPFVLWTTENIIFSLFQRISSILTTVKPWKIIQNFKNGKNNCLGLVAHLKMFLFMIGRVTYHSKNLVSLKC